MIEGILAVLLGALAGALSCLPFWLLFRFFAWIATPWPEPEKPLTEDELNAYYEDFEESAV